MRSFWQSACATTNSRDDGVSPSSTLADEAAAKSKETAGKKEKKKGKRSDTCDKFVGVGFHCGQRDDDDDDTAAKE